MSVEWANPESGFDLHLPLDGRSGRRAAIERALRDAIRDGRLKPGARLPATRALANDLGVARGTVAEAYAQLRAEGFLTAHRGSGTTVAASATDQRSADPGSATPPPLPRHDLRPFFGDPSSFPRAAWVRATRWALREATDAAMLGDVPGQPALREALAEYLGRARGVVTTPDRIVVCNGFTQAFDVLCRALVRGGATRMAFEQPCAPDYRVIARNAGLDTTPRLPVDESGARIGGDVQADAALLTPAHQFPLGATLAPERRAAIVAWARDNDAYVIEDDYDGEFRYDRQPVGALQGLDPERVVYAGTATKMLGPSLRIGWLALPEALVRRVQGMKFLADRMTSPLEQLALARLIESGELDRHVRRMRARYRDRRDRLLELVDQAAPHVRTFGIAAGLHVVLQTDDEHELLVRARERDVAILGLSDFQPSSEQRGLVAGFGASPEHAFPAALDALAGVLRSN